MDKVAGKRSLEDDMAPIKPEDLVAEPPKKTARTINISKDAKGVDSDKEMESEVPADLPPPRVYLDPELFDLKNESKPIFVHAVLKDGRREVFPMFDAEGYVGSCVRTGMKFSVSAARKYDIAAKKEVKRCYGCLFISGWNSYWDKQLEYIYEDLENAAKDGLKTCGKFLSYWKEVSDLTAEQIFPKIETGGLRHAQDCAMTGAPFDESIARAHDKSINIEYEANDLPYWCYTCDYLQCCTVRAKKRYQAMSKAWEKFDEEHS